MRSYNAASNIVSDLFGTSTDLWLLLLAYCINIVLAGGVGLLLIQKYQKRHVG